MGTIRTLITVIRIERPMGLPLLRYSHFMGLSFRTILMWLLVLAVPAQGAAAATMAFCGPNHHGAVSVAHGQQGSAAEHEHHGSDARNAHTHRDMSAEVDEDVATLANTAEPAKAGHSVKQKCSACASCCSFGALLTTLLALPTPDSTPTVFSTVVPSVDAFAADGPDRPPRIALA